MSSLIPVGETPNSHKPRPWVWELRKIRTWELIANLLTKTQSTFQVDFCKRLQLEASGGGPLTPGATGEEKSSDLFNTVPAGTMFPALSCQKPGHYYCAQWGCETESLGHTDCFIVLEIITCLWPQAMQSHIHKDYVWLGRELKAIIGKLVEPGESGYT